MSAIEEISSSAVPWNQRPEEVKVREAIGMLAQTRELLQSNLRGLLEAAQGLMPAYDGLPAAMNIMTLLGRQTDEVSHSSVLAWLLSPDEGHGLGDTLLRQLLARSSRSLGAKLATRDEPLKAHLATEVQIDVRRADIVGILPGVVVFIEVKVDAVEHQDQTKHYREGLEAPERRAVALRRFGEHAKIVGTAPVVLGFFLRRRGRGESSDEECTNIDWLQIDADLHRAACQCTLTPDAQTLVRSLRSTLLESSGSAQSPMSTIVRIRRMLMMPSTLRHAPLKSALLLTQFLTEQKES